MIILDCILSVNLPIKHLVFIMTSKNLIYLLIPFFLVVIMSFGYALAFVTIDGQTLAQFVGIEKPRELRNLYASGTSSDIITRPVVTNKPLDNKATIKESTKLQSDDKKIRLPPNLPQSVIKKHIFTEIGRAHV